MAYDDDSESEAFMMMASEEDEDDFMDEDDDDESEDDGGLAARLSKKKAPAAPAPKAKAAAAVKAVVAKKPKAKPTTQKAAAAQKKKVQYDDDDDDDEEDDDSPPLAPKENVVNNNSASKAKGSKPNKTIEEMYQKKSPLEHILLRPDTYVGSTLRDTGDMYVLQNDRIVLKTIQYTPGLFKIFDEIVVNAADNKQRDGDMDRLDITIDAPTNTISVKNNGKGIPVQIHKEHGIYVPTLIFGHLLTGSNFDDDEKKTTGGRNGYGAKLANVFSTRFVVECVDAAQGVKFHQVFTNNMSKANEPTLKKCTASELKAGDYVQITFSPDLPRFGMSTLDDDTVALLSKRAYDIAGTMTSRGGKKLVVSLNGKKLPIKSFKDYLGLFEGLEAPVAYEKTDRWEVGVAPSNDASPHQVSFVNAICTSKGGGHVNYIADQIAAHLVKVLKKKKKKDVKPAQIKNHLTIYVNCLVENPSFDSQTKDFLTSKHKTFGSKCELPDKFLKTVEKSAIVTTIDSFLSFREREALKRKGGTKKIKLTGISKLDDANFAGTAKSRDCTLIITEGDSAKSLAMAGLSVVGRDYYGVFPLRGKPLNVRDSTLAQVTKNEEIKNLVDIMGLKFGVKYDADNVKSLRYGHLMIMADQDTDGSHIKGLVINFIHHFWPSLLDVPGFLQQFITPIVKVTKRKRSISFFSLPEYQQWLGSTGNNGKGYKTKYYKGLGTSTSVEAKEYFSSLDLHEVKFANLSLDESHPDDDMEDDTGSPKKAVSGTDLIDLVFRKDRVNDRKEWLNTFSKEVFLDYREVSEVGELKYSDFINKEYIIFSNYDNERSIPNIMDGFKPSQRKVLFACFKRKLKNEIKVAQLTGYVAEHSAYHHGEQSLQQTIVGLAQNFVGSNNVNLLTPSGQFGTRRMGGKDAASPRYIFTCLEPIARTIFHPDDDDLLTYLNDDGATIEPEFYVPVIPMVLVNGSDGIGTGYSSAISNYNPREIIANLRRKLNGEQVEPMTPYYYGFDGDILVDDKKSGTFKVHGKIERVDDTTLLITELPLKKWTQDYKQFLETMITGGEKQPPEIKDFKENHTESTVRFTIVAEKDKLDAFEKDKTGLMGKFKLNSSLSTTNMNLFDPEKRIVKYASPEDIMTEFFQVRLDFYVKRKVMLVAKLEREQRMLSNKARFVEEVCSGALVVNNRKRKELLSDLQNRGYETFLSDPKKKGPSDPSEEDDGDKSDSEDEERSDSDLGKGYEYLLGMKIWSLTYEKAEAIRAQLAEKTAELETLKATSPEQLWHNDLDAVEAALDQRDIDFEQSAKEEQRAQKKNQKRQAKKKPAARGKKKKDEWDSDMERSSDSESDDDDESEDAPAPVRKPSAPRPKPTIKKPSAAPVAKSSAASAPAPKKPSQSVDKPTIARPLKDSVMELDSNAESDSDGSFAHDRKPAAKKPVATKAKAVASAKTTTKFPESDSDESFGEKALFERLKTKQVAPHAESKPSTNISKKRPSPKNDEMEEDEESIDDDDNFALASVTPAKGKVAKTASTKTQVAKKARSMPLKKVSSAAVPAKKAVDHDDAESDLEFRSERDIPRALKPAPARARSGRASSKQPVVYNVDSDESSDDYDDDSE